MRTMLFRTEPFRRTGVVAWCPKDKRKSSRLNKHLRFPSAQVKVTVNLHTPEFKKFEHVSM
jgi:hypothetical protein